MERDQHAEGRPERVEVGKSLDPGHFERIAVVVPVVGRQIGSHDHDLVAPVAQVFSEVVRVGFAAPDHGVERPGDDTDLHDSTSLGGVPFGNL